MAGHRFNPERANVLVDPKRKELVDPDRVISLLDVGKNDRIGDFGAGNGYLTLPLAKATEQNVFAVDIEPKMLDLLKERAAAEDITNIQYVESNLEEIKLGDRSAERGVCAFVMHEVPKMEKALQEFKRIIVPGGRMLILEWEAVETEQGPPLHERIPSADFQKFVQEQGFECSVTALNKAIYAVTIDFA